MGRISSKGDAGLGLVEALVASGLLVTVAVGVAHLTAMTSRSIARAAAETTSLLLAVQKMEQLRSLQWTYTRPRDGVAAGVVSDLATNLATDPPTSTGGGLQISPADALRTDTPGYVDYLDRRGAWIGTGSQPTAGTAFVRRWSVARVSSSRDDRRVLQVVVMPLTLAIQASGVELRPNQPYVVWLATLRSRR